MPPRINYSGLVVAGTGFFLTRFTVTLAISEDPLRFYVGGIVPLVLGLGLAAFGVALVVADVEASLVRTTAAWCVAGAGTMLVLVVLTLVATDPRAMLDLGAVRSQTYLANFLIGGSVGGTLTGLYAANNRHQRVELRQQANRLEALNRLLRHEVLNAVTVIKGHAALATDARPEVWAAIEDRSDAIERTIDEVKTLASSGRAAGPSTAVDLAATLGAGVETVRAGHPAVAVEVAALPESVAVRGADRLDRVFTHLLEEAVARSTGHEPTVRVSVASSQRTARVTIRYTGTPLSANQRALLERGEIEPYDNPQRGFRLDVVRLLVENCGGSIETDVAGTDESITVVLPRAARDPSVARSDPFAMSGLQPAVPPLLVGLASAIVAGVVYGITSETLGGSIAGIGVFYGTASPVVGWITHEFHSVVFGFVYLGLVSKAPRRFRDGVIGYVAIGIGWAVVLWVVAAGLVAPVWLRLLGIPAPIPNLSPVLLVNHLAWGGVLALLTAVGLRVVLPRLTADHGAGPAATN